MTKRRKSTPQKESRTLPFSIALLFAAIAAALIYKIIATPPHHYGKVSVHTRLGRVKSDLERIALEFKTKMEITGDIPQKAQLEAFLAHVPVPNVDHFTAGSLFAKQKQYTLRIRNSTLLIYSVGPDGKDDMAAVLYDPTNGAHSTGDIWVTVNP